MTDHPPGEEWRSGPLPDPPALREKVDTQHLADGPEIPYEPPDDAHLAEIRKMRIARLIAEGRA